MAKPSLSTDSRHRTKSPFSVTADLLRALTKLARSHKNVCLHTHLAETLDDERYTRKNFDVRPVGLMEKWDWVGNDVWFAHSVHVNDADIKTYSGTGCGVAHCPSSNMRLASGIAPVWKYRQAGVKVGLGVDGSSSNDSAVRYCGWTWTMQVAAGFCRWMRQ